MLRSARHKTTLDAESDPATNRFAPIRGRRWRPAAAAAAYSLALTVLRSEHEAEQVAKDALTRGAHSRIGVLAHARHQSLARAIEPSTADLDELASSDVREVARQLSATRPAIERAIVDLEMRYGLDSASFARSLGVSQERAAERARAVSDAWASQLDPAMVAWLGAGTCPELESALTEQELSRQMRVRDLLAAAPVVLEHSQTCSNCAERLRLLTPVRTLVGQAAPETVPDVVASIARSARRRLASALPPSIEPRRIDAGRVRFIAVCGSIAIAVICAAIGISRAIDDPKESQADRVARLVQSAPTSRLLGTPSIMTSATPTAALANNGTEIIFWRAETDASWLTISPTEGRLTPNQSISLVVRTSAIPANSPSDATITITGNDGSLQTIRYEAN